MQRLKDYAPFLTGILLIVAALCLPLGLPGAPSLIDYFSSWASNLLATPF